LLRKNFELSFYTCLQFFRESENFFIQEFISIFTVTKFDYRCFQLNVERYTEKYCKQNLFTDKLKWRHMTLRTSPVKDVLQHNC
jgi:hypothetical protein